MPGADKERRGSAPKTMPGYPLPFPAGSVRPARGVCKTRHDKTERTSQIKQNLLTDFSQRFRTAKSFAKSWRANISSSLKPEAMSCSADYSKDSTGAKHSAARRKRGAAPEITKILQSFVFAFFTVIFIFSSDIDCLR
jgi:hypothetical protein